MRPTVGPISGLTQSALRRLSRLQDISDRLALPVTPESRRTISYVTIEAANLWSQYSRCLFLSAALGARDAAGVPVVATPAADESHAIDLAVHAVRPKLRGTRRSWGRTDLPDWQSKSDLAKMILYINASVFPQVDAAVSYKTRVLSDLPTMRNFYAHKAERAAAKAVGLGPHYGVTRRLPPPDLLCTAPPGSSRILLNEWLADLEAILSLMP